MPAENPPPRHAPPDPPAPHAGRSVLGAVAMRVLAPALGAVLGYFLLAAVYLPRAGLGSELQRIPEMAGFAASFTPDRPTLFILGDSLMIEGVDAALIEAVEPRWAARNLALNGNTPTAMSVQLPTLLRARPAAVALSFRPEDLGTPPAIPGDRAYAYAYAGFADNLPRPLDFPGIDAETRRALDSSRYAQNIRFRPVMIRSINDRLRFVLRRGLRAPADDDWTAPFNMAASIGGPRLRRHIEDTLDALVRRTDNGKSVDGVALPPLIVTIRDAGAIPIIIIPPQHPELRDAYTGLTRRLREAADALALTHSGVVIDASSLLTADQFADALHPNEAGRAELSRFIAEHLPAPPPTPAAATP